MIVVDASVAAKWLFPEDDYELANALRDDALTRGEQLVGPHLLPIEITNIVRQRMRRAGLSTDEAEAALRTFNRLRVETLPASVADRNRVYRDVLLLSERYALPAAYDGHYLALAQDLGCELWTADEQFVARLNGQAPFVRRLADYVPL